jgi:glutamate-1-semialdehyde aminotransferase/acyl carrier protein
VLPVLTLSAASAKSLQLLCGQYADYLANGLTSRLADVCYTANISRGHLAYRWARAAQDVESLVRQLREAAEGRQSERTIKKVRNSNVVFAFNGQGAQFPGMGRELYRYFPVFRDAIDLCDKWLRLSWTATSLRDVLHGDEKSSAAMLARTEFVQPAIFAYQYALAQLWLSFGVRPSCVIGHSLGEYTAACLAGAMSLRDTLTLLVARGRLMQSIREDGRMAALYASEQDVLEMLVPYGQRLSIAAINAPQAVVVAGRASDIEDIVQQCGKRRVAAKALPGSQAYHCADVDPVLDEFERVADAVAYANPQIHFVSNITGKPVTSARQLSGRYWREHMRGTVQFAKGIQNAVQAGASVLLEIGADSVLSSVAGRCVPSGELHCVSSARAARPERQMVSEALASLHAAGVSVDWTAVHAGTALERVELPTYSFDRKRYWLLPEKPPNDPLEIHAVPHAAIQTIRSDKQTTPAPMKTSQPANPSASRATSFTAVLPEIRSMVASLLELDAGQVDIDAPFVEMGADSLILLSAIHAVEDKYGIHLTINQLFEDTSTIRLLAAFIETNAVIHHAVREDVPAEPARGTQTVAAQQAAKSTAPGIQAFSGTNMTDDSRINELFKEQLSVISQQLQLLQGAATLVSIDYNTPPPAAAASNPRIADAASSGFSWGKVVESAGASHGLPAWARSPVQSHDIDGARKAYLDRLLEKHISRTSSSKKLAQQYRKVLADNRVSAGFRLSTKEGIYPLVGERAQGSRMWDIDGNEYIDFTMGFGANLFGHSPDFVVDELKKQIDEGFQIGPQSALAGIVAERIARMTGQDRVAFCNSGSEAVMTAVRLARAVAKRSKIAIFSGSYHGVFDGILARARVADGRLMTVPMAPGTPNSFVEREVMVLEYGQEESLRILSENAHELAAVIVEPVQSRFPANQPVEFLRALRTLTQQKSITLIWDETITGFRAAPGGAQEYFGVSADIATYGKIIGGGMPIGVVAGKGRFMDAIDGGNWSYGDDSYPKAEQTFFAGTFSKHPMAMRAALAVLKQLEQAGPDLYHTLNQRTADLARTLNDFFAEKDFPLRIEYFSSLFRFSFSGNMDILFMRLMTKGIYIWEGRNCFLSTAHSDSDIQALVDAVKESVLELRENDFLPPANPANRTGHADRATAAISLNASQKRFARLAKVPGDARICHIGFSVRLLGADLQPTALEEAFNQILQRHDILRASFDLAADTQVFALHERVALDCVDLTAIDPARQSEAVREWQQNEVARTFDLSRAPLLRVSLLRLNADEHVLHLTIHHMICDGLSLALLLDEVSRLYSARGLPGSLKLAQPLSFAEDRAKAGLPGSGSAEAQTYWSEQLMSPPARLLPLASPALAGSSEGERVRIVVDGGTLNEIKSVSKTQKCTPFMVLFAAYGLLLSEQSSQRDLLIGVPVIERMPRHDQVLLGTFVNLMPIRFTLDEGERFESLLRKIKDQLLGAYRHSAHAYEPSGWVPFTTFNLEPQTVPPGFGNLKVELLECPVTHVEFDVMLNVTESQSEFHVDLDFRYRTLKAATAQEWLARYRDILRRIASEGVSWQIEFVTTPTSEIL